MEKVTVARRTDALLMFLLVVVLASPGGSLTLDSSQLSHAIQDLANDLGVEKMQAYADALKYTSSPRDPEYIADRLTQEIERTFMMQADALEKIKTMVENSYDNADFTDRSAVIQCCNVENLYQSYQFTVDITDDYSCDRISEAADPSANSINGKLDSVYKDNNKSPMKWQYFGSEYGIINQFPTSKAPDCDTYDHRFRPWYIASATPNPKDVVLVIKSNLFETDPAITEIQFEAVNIILRTLSPKDRLAVLLYNNKVIKVTTNGCYSNSMSSATPANIERFQYFLQIRPDPQDGNDLLTALETAYDYFDNRTKQKRDRAVLLFTDGERIDKTSDQTAIMNMLKKNTALNASLFVFIAVMDKIPDDVRLFYQELVDSSDVNAQNHYVELPETSDLRRTMTVFYQSFAITSTSSSDEFSPVFMPPYFDLFGLDQLVLTLATPCYKKDNLLVGVAAVDLTTSDLLASIEYFNEGELSYAFIIDNEGMTLYHPYLPVPSTNYTFVYLDIATLEPGPGFSEIKESMISGGSGCKNISSSHVLSRGTTLHDGASILDVPSTYCWKAVQGTPFSLCVVIPIDSTFLELTELSSTFPSPVDDIYHRIDVPSISEGLHLCQYLGHNAVMNQSTVKLSPESYSIPERYLIDNETDDVAEYMQHVVTTLSDPKQKLKAGVIDSIAMTHYVNSLWNNEIENKNSILWKYITTSDGVSRVLPGIQVTPKAVDPTLEHWYQRAMAHVGITTISFPYHNKLSGGLVITLSQAIVLPLHDNSVLGVMASDFTLAYFQRLLQDQVAICSETDHYKCILIDNTAYVISHPTFVSDPGIASYTHLTQIEPFIAQDMLALGYLEKILCNNFQYNTNFTVGPRRQVSYEVTNMVTTATTEPLEGGYSRYCVFYKIAPVNMTNTFVIAVDLDRSAKSKCFPITCPCNPDVSCSSLPDDCVCPCYQDLPPENYNPCEETFQNLTAPPCPVRFAVTSSKACDHETPASLDTSLPVCFYPNCSSSTVVECESQIGCKYCPVDHSDKYKNNQCMTSSTCPPPLSALVPISTPTMMPSVATLANGTEAVPPTSWALVAGVFIGSTAFACLTIVVLIVLVMVLWRKPRRLHLETNSSHDSDGSVTLKRVGEESHQHPHSEMELIEVRYEKEPRPPGGFQTTGTPTESSVSYTPSHLTGDTAYASGQYNGSEGFSVFTEHLEHPEGGPSTVGSIDPSHVGGIWF